MAGRLESIKKNVIYGLAFQIINTLAVLISRIVFLRYLDSAYLGVSGLFANIISILSISELGIGVAISYALYKPLAEKDYEKIKSIMYLFKRAYFFIGLAIVTIGVLIIPLFPFIINNTTGIQNITIYYFFFLFDTAIGYFISYRTILITADQSEYKIKKIQSIGSLFVVFFQIFALIVTQSYFLYLLATSLVKLSILILTRVFVAKEYPYVKEKKVDKLNQIERSAIFKNIKDLIIHKIGTALSWQTDNIIISAFLSLEMVGIASNYLYIYSQLTIYIFVVLSAAIASLGNIAATQNKESWLVYFKRYRFVSYWIHGWIAIGFCFLTTPLVFLLFGEKYVISQYSVFFLALTLAIKGEGAAMYNFKIACGMYSQDKHVAFIQAILNLIISVIGVNIFGITGVFIGSFISSLYGIIVRCNIVYKELFKGRIIEILIGTASFLSFLVTSFIIIEFVSLHLAGSVVGNFVILGIGCIIIPNILFFAFFAKSEEFKYYFNLIQKKISSFRK